MNQAPKIKIYGCRNSGTNYLKKLIEKNLEIDVIDDSGSPKLTRLAFRLDRVMEVLKLKNYISFVIFFRTWFYKLNFKKKLGWKHTLPKDSKKIEKAVDNKVYFITITKNPYAWLLSMYRRPHSAYDNVREKTFKEFLTHRWKVMIRDNGPKYYKNPIIMWNEKNGKYLKITNELPGKSLTYEQVLASPEKAVKKVKDITGAKQKNEKIENIENSTKKPDKDFRYYSDYYLNSRWKKKLDSESIKTINLELDQGLMDKFGYELIDPYQI